MKFGNLNINVQFKEKFDSSNLAHYHVDDDCAGNFKVVKEDEYVYMINDLGPIKINGAYFLKCSKCSSKIFLPGFIRFLNLSITCKLIFSHAPLKGEHLRFLRKQFGLKQTQVASKIGYKDLKRYTKFESKKAVSMLPSDRLEHLRIMYVQMLTFVSPTDKLKAIDSFQGNTEGSVFEFPSTLDLSKDAELKKLVKSVKDRFAKAA